MGDGEAANAGETNKASVIMGGNAMVSRILCARKQDTAVYLFLKVVNHVPDRFFLFAFVQLSPETFY